MQIGGVTRAKDGRLSSVSWLFVRIGHSAEIGAVEIAVGLLPRADAKPGQAPWRLYRRYYWLNGLHLYP